MHAVRTQFCAYLPSPNVAESLKGLTVLFGQTIATGKGVINLAKLLDLEFEKPYVDPQTSQVTAVLIVKTQAKSRGFWCAIFFEKEARSAADAPAQGPAENWKVSTGSTSLIPWA